MTTVAIEHVSKYYGQQTILSDVNLSLSRGEFVAVIGPSGCGKSTLLRLVSGLDDVCEGNILINGQCVNKTPAHKRDMAMVFQSYALYPHMTVFDNMAYGLKMRGMNRSDITKRVIEVAGLLRLTEFLQRKPGLLSGGQRQRVAMGRAIVRSPAVFLFDEPLSNLDASLRTEMRHEIKKLHQQLQTTCLYVTHDHTEAMTLASRIVVLNKGKVEQIGTPQQLYQEPASLFVASFTGVYPINFIPSTLDIHSGKIISDTGIEMPLPTLSTQLAHGEKLMIGIRPEHCKIKRGHSKDSIPVQIEFIDDLGADKLLHLTTLCKTHKLSARVSADTELPATDMSMELMTDKMTLFHQDSGLRLGGWA